MALGPIELLVVKFPGNQFNGEIAPGIEGADRQRDDPHHRPHLRHQGRGRHPRGCELDALGDESLHVFKPAPSELSGTLTEDDARSLSGGLENNSSAAIMLFENTWAARFAEAMRNANGELILNERIPRAVIEELIAEISSPEAIEIGEEAQTPA